MEVTNQEQARAVGKILGNTTKLKILLLLARSPMPKRKVAEMADVAWSTAWAYLSEIHDAGLTDEYYFTDGSSSMTMVRLKSGDVNINLDKIKDVKKK